MVCVAVDHYFPPFSESCALRMMMASVVSGSGGPRKGATATKKRAEQILWSKEEETTPCYFPSEPETFLRRIWQLQKNGDFTLASMAICPSCYASPAKIFNQLDAFILSRASIVLVHLGKKDSQSSISSNIRCKILGS